MIIYHNCFVENLIGIVHPVNPLLSNIVLLEWTTKCEEVMKFIEDNLSTPINFFHKTTQRKVLIIFCFFILYLQRVATLSAKIL